MIETMMPAVSPRPHSCRVHTHPLSDAQMHETNGTSHGKVNKITATAPQLLTLLQ
jgi:hypothetical protein